jgi:hypothetical protein
MTGAVALSTRVTWKKQARPCFGRHGNNLGSHSSEAPRARCVVGKYARPRLFLKRWLSESALRFDHHEPGQADDPTMGGHLTGPAVAALLDVAILEGALHPGERVAPLGWRVAGPRPASCPRKAAVLLSIAASCPSSPPKPLPNTASCLGKPVSSHAPCSQLHWTPTVAHRSRSRLVPPGARAPLQGQLAASSQRSGPRTAQPAVPEPERPWAMGSQVPSDLDSDQRNRRRRSNRAAARPMGGQP